LRLPSISKIISHELFMLKEHNSFHSLDGRGLRGGCP